ncbi:hypothetical protein KM043_015901 [Ampulex compressa]|nr:hypothetical protein KM043_015901 [Ampulex compressa]
MTQRATEYKYIYSTVYDELCGRIDRAEYSTELELKVGMFEERGLMRQRAHRMRERGDSGWNLNLVYPRSYRELLICLNNEKQRTKRPLKRPEASRTRDSPRAKESTVGYDGSASMGGYQRRLNGEDARHRYGHDVDGRLSYARLTGNTNCGRSCADSNQETRGIKDSGDGRLNSDGVVSCNGDRLANCPHSPNGVTAAGQVDMFVQRPQDDNASINKYRSGGRARYGFYVFWIFLGNKNMLRPETLALGRNIAWRKELDGLENARNRRREVLAGGILISSGELANSFIQTFISWRICYGQVAVPQIVLLCLPPSSSFPPTEERPKENIIPNDVAGLCNAEGRWCTLQERLCFRLEILLHPTKLPKKPQGQRRGASVEIAVLKVSIHRQTPRVKPTNSDP